ncbi:hypothetical protein B0A55_10566 [Friedmanniomyces simplex]|uniref:F-box domain-containing protein n=1 Tax=Friedmanniomyces simplex TaxID=329884 RepID=A0A4U0WPN5_9PEZI|nr:hypothetical protein B0A55_10566 [Friedmanniomyces simplex]
MADQEGAKAPFLTLPPELVELVAAELRPKDLLALRQVCRDVHNGVQRPFIQAHFSEKSFLLPSMESMQALVDISEHAAFGKALKQINLLALAVPKKPSGYWLQSRRTRRHQEPDRNRDERVQNRDGRRLYQQMCEVQDAFWRSHGWSSFLIKALENLNKSVGSIWIAFSSVRGAFKSACGLKSLELMLGLTDCLVSIVVGNTDSAALLRAISEGGCPVVGFTSGGSTQGKPAPPQLLTESTNARGASIFATLRFADIYLCEPPVPHKETLGRMASFLVGAHSLEHVVLRRATSYTFRSHTDVLDTDVHLPKLQKIEIQGMYPASHDLTAFCKRHKESLRRVEISGPWNRLALQHHTLAQRREGVKRTLMDAGVEFEVS